MTDTIPAASEAPDLSSSVSTLPTGPSPASPSSSSVEDDLGVVDIAMADKLAQHQHQHQHQIDKHKVESALSRLASLTTDPDVHSSCMLYPDTAPRTTWRPQMYAWMKKNYPQKLREISQAPVAPLHPLSSDPGHHYDTTTSPPRRAGSVGSAGGGGSVVSASHRRLSHAHESKPYSRPHPDDHHDPGSMILSASSSSSALSASSSSSYPSTAHDHNAQKYSYSHTQSSSAYTNPANLPFTTSAKLPSPPQSPKLSPNSGQEHKNNSHTSNHHQNHNHQNSNYTFSVKMGSNSYHHRRRCISCGSDQSPCWRPSWSPSAGQLCNSCGLRYKKTGARCTSPSCGRIPAKGEWVMMKRNASGQDPPEYHCLSCGGHVAVGETL